MRIRHAGLIATVAAGLLLALAGGCGRKTVKPPSETRQLPKPAVTLRVWLPCGLAKHMKAFDGILTGGNPRLSVDYEIINVWELVKRLEETDTPPDLIIMLGDQEIGQLQKAGKLDVEPVTWAYDQLAVLTHRANPARLESFEDLVRVNSLVLGPENTSIGYYARAALRKAGIYEKVKDKIIVPETPAEMYNLIASGKAQAAIAFAGCAFPVPAELLEPKREVEAQKEEKALPKAAPPRKKRRPVIVLGPVPEKYCEPFPAYAAIPKGAPNPQDARAALDELLSPPSQAEVARFMPKPAMEPVSLQGQVRLHMYCGAGIRPPVEELARKFEADNPGVRLDIAYAGSGCLLAQLTFAKRGDLYMPGEAYYLDQAEQRGFLVERKHIAYFVPVILVAKGNPKGVKDLRDLLRPDLKVAIGDPDSAAIGRVTKVIYERLGLWDELVKRAPRRALNVPELAYWVSLGTCDAAVTWQAQAHQFADRCDYISIPTELYDPVEIAVGLLTFSEHKDIARKFMDLLSSPEGQRVFEENGYAIELRRAEAKGASAGR